MIKIKNWSSYQSYKDRRPPWIRFHRSILDNYEYQTMSAEARALLPMLWLLACEHEDPKAGIVDLEIKKIAFRLRQSTENITYCIKELQAVDFIECIESVTKPLQGRTPDVTPETETEERQTTTAHAPKNGANATEYSKEFLNAWEKYPKRAGGNPKLRAFKAWRARLKQGHTEQSMTDGVSRYAKYCDKTGKIGTEVVMQTATFFGPDEQFLEDWLVSGVQLQANKPEWARIPRNDDDLWKWAKKHGYQGPGSLTYPQYRGVLNRAVDKRINNGGTH